MRHVPNPAPRCQPGRSPQVDGTPPAGPLVSPWTRAARLLEGWLLPPRCVLCLDPGSLLPTGDGRRTVLDLCEGCRRDLPWLDAACPQCAVPVPRSAAAVLQPCGACRQAGASAPVTASFAPFRYDWPVAPMVHALKYRGERSHGRVLATLVAHAARQRQVELPELLVPVPLHPERERSRGFNQARDLAERVGVELRLPRATALRRVRDTPAQAGLTASERRRNLQGAFALVVRQQPAVAGRHVALVDDVLTTGSTAALCAEVLLAAGARRVDAWAVARA